MSVYALGFSAVCACAVGLYLNAWRQRKSLELNALEETLTKVYIWDDLGMVVMGIVVFVIAQILPPEKSSYAPLAFFLIGVWKTAHGYITARYVEAARLRAGL